MERSDYDFNLKTYELPRVALEIASMKREKIIALTRERYGHVIPSMESEKHETEREEPQEVPVEIKQAPRVPVETKVEVDTRPKLTPPSQRVSVPPDDLSTRKDISQHRYFQTLIKKMAEQRGYRAVIEEPTGDGGRVDVGLERDGKRIACEISVTTGDTQELHNIEKGLKAGYDPVIVCSPEKKNLEAIRKLAAEKLPPTDQGKILLFEPEELFAFLDEQITQEAKSEQRIKGYRVKVEYRAMSESEKKQKREAVAQVIARSLRGRRAQTQSG